MLGRLASLKVGLVVWVLRRTWLRWNAWTSERWKLGGGDSESVPIYALTEEEASIGVRVVWLSAQPDPLSSQLLN